MVRPRKKINHHREIPLMLRLRQEPHRMPSMTTKRPSKSSSRMQMMRLQTSSFPRKRMEWSRNSIKSMLTPNIKKRNGIRKSSNLQQPRKKPITRLICRKRVRLKTDGLRVMQERSLLTITQKICYQTNKMQNSIKICSIR